ncbi:MAG: hypothetical protein HKN33_08425 [Pyrinomonadaceae bacterium]|nr:hypothetical protein [Pyrinomonadaceae bacterium]
MTEEEKTMPGDIKAAAIAIVVSCVFSMTSRSLDYIYPSDVGGNDTIDVVFAFIWIALIIWIVWDLLRNRRDIRLTLGVVSVIMFIGNAASLLTGAFTAARLFEVLELLSWLGAFYFLNTTQAKEWYKLPKSA